jgi:hypothetical protein
MALRPSARRALHPRAARQPMPRRRPVLPVEIVPVLIAVAILGYVAGHSTRSSHPSERQTERGADVALGYPAGWRMARIAPGIPELSVADVIVIAPKGNAEKAGLMLGGLPPGEVAPLPVRFVATLPRLPVPEIVNLVETQAYRYSRLSVPGYGRRLTLFVIPNPGGRPMMFGCYASAGHLAQMRACEQSVATVTTVGEPRAYQLTPEPRYATAIRAAVSTLDRLRAELKRELRPDVTVATAQQLATELEQGFAAAAAALDRLHPSIAAEPVHAALTDAVRRAHDGYLALAAAIGERNVKQYEAAQKRIGRAEADVDSALGSFVLLGYSSTPRPQGAAGANAGS